MYFQMDSDFCGWKSLNFLQESRPHHNIILQFKLLTYTKNFVPNCLFFEKVNNYCSVYLPQGIIPTRYFGTYYDIFISFVTIFVEENKISFRLRIQ